MMVRMPLGPSAILIPRKVGALEGTFFVPDYQRGYRWGAAEVIRLLDDIKEAGSDNYYLQPVIVKAMDDGRWELIDGQQRLTTLYLVLRTIREYWRGLAIPRLGSPSWGLSTCLRAPSGRSTRMPFSSSRGTPSSGTSMPGRRVGASIRTSWTPSTKQVSSSSSTCRIRVAA